MNVYKQAWALIWYDPMNDCKQANEWLQTSQWMIAKKPMNDCKEANEWL